MCEISDACIGAIASIEVTLIDSRYIRKIIVGALLFHKFKEVHRLIDELIERGIISESEYESPMRELGELILLEGEKFRKRAINFAEKLKRYLNVPWYW